MKTLKTLSWMMAVALVATVNLRAGDTSAANPYFGKLSAVSPAELPAMSAKLVSQADSKNRLQTTVDVVKAAVGLNPAAAPAIVGTIAKATPEMASVAAATAVALVPNQAIVIARAAAAAAPSQAGKIVEAVCRLVPNAYKAVANTVAEVAPGAGKAILAGVSAAIPTLQEPIAKVLAGYKPLVAASASVANAAAAKAQEPKGKVQPSVNADNPSVSDVLDKAAGPISAPHYGDPFVSIPPSPPVLDPNNGGEVVTGGRQYNTPPGP